MRFKMKAKLTQRQVKALDESIRIWRWLSKTGMSKYDYANEVDDSINEYWCQCPLCDEFICEEDCPLGDCVNTSHPYTKWNNAIKTSTRKKYAQMVLGMLLNARRKNRIRRRKKIASSKPKRMGKSKIRV